MTTPVKAHKFLHTLIEGRNNEDLSFKLLVADMAKYCNSNAVLSGGQQASLEKALHTLDRQQSLPLQETVACVAIAAWINTCKG